MHFTRRPFAFPDELGGVLTRRFGDFRAAARGLKDLWPLLAQGRGQADRAGKTKHYSLQAAFAEAYAAYYLPANAMKLALVLEEARVFGLPLGTSPTNGPLRWLDVGCGPGTALWGLAWWAKHRGLSFEYRGLEQSKNFLSVAGELGRELLVALFGQGFGSAGRASAEWREFRHGGSQGSLADRVREYHPHVLSLVNSVGELAPGLDERAALMGEAIDALAALGSAGPGSARDGQPRWLVLVEPGSKAASRELLELRDRLRARADTRIWLPCLSARPCGALARPDDWCHEEAALQFPEWMDRLGAEAGLRKEAVLFSYLVCSVGKHPDEPASWASEGKRVVSQLMREKGLTQCFLCTSGGKVRARVLNSRVTEANEGFGSWVRGQVFDDVRLTEKGDVESYAGHAVPDELDPTVFPPLRSDRRS